MSAGHYKICKSVRRTQLQNLNATQAHVAHIFCEWPKAMDSELVLTGSRSNGTNGIISCWSNIPRFFCKNTVEYTILYTCWYELCQFILKPIRFVLIPRKYRVPDNQLKIIYLSLGIRVNSCIWFPRGSFPHLL